MMVLGLLTILTTAACQVTPTQPPPAATTVPTKARDTDPQSLLERAEHSPLDSAARMRLTAAESFYAAGDQQAAGAALDAVDSVHLDGSDQFTYYKLRARLALAAQDLPAAHLALSLTVPTDPTERNLYLLTSADLAEAEQRYEAAAATLMGYTFSAKISDESQNAALVDRIWADVNRTPAYRISALAAQSQNESAAAWWQLADAMQRSFDLNSGRTAITTWRRNHRDHPASRWPPSALVLIESEDSAPPTRIALLLPISGELTSAGRAVRDGFLAAYYHAGSSASIHVYDTNGAAIGGLYDQACSDGAQLIIGPLDKPSVGEINAAPFRRVPIIALNYLPSGVAAQNGLIQFGLAIEDEASAIARQVFAEGLVRVAIVQSDLDWSTRASESFRSQFAALGGTVVSVGVIKDARAVTETVGAVLLVNSSIDRLESLSKTIGTRPEFAARRRSDVDALIAFTDPAQARALNSATAYHFAADVPIYTTSQATGGSTQGVLQDLNGIRLTELPWQVYPSAIRDEVASAFSSAQAALSPLYALGVDAFRLSERADLLAANSPGRLLGETGQLQVQSSGVVTRDPAWAIVQHGSVVAIPSVAP